MERQERDQGGGKESEGEGEGGMNGRKSVGGRSRREGRSAHRHR